jgi:hypothetical protein
MQEACTWREKTRTFDQQTAADPTIPRTVQQKKAAVKLVFKAYKSVALATDNAGMLRAFLEQKHDNRHVEIICWSLVDGCIDRCDRGPLLKAYEPDKAKNTSNIRSFADRLDAIVESLTQQKTICKHLLDAPYLNRFVDDPVGSRQRVESNRKLNKKKGGVMDVGKHALGMIGKRGRSNTGGAQTPEVESDDAEMREHQRMSSSLSAPFQTPAQIKYINDSPAVGYSPIPSSRSTRNYTLTPPTGNRHEYRSAAPSPAKNTMSESPCGEAVTSKSSQHSNSHLGNSTMPMHTMSSNMRDPTLTAPLPSNLYSMTPTADSRLAFGASATSRIPLDFPHYYPYTSGFHGDFLSSLSSMPTSVPTSTPRPVPYQTHQPEALEGVDFTESETGGSNHESNDSDGEFLPGPKRKRQRC